MECGICYEVRDNYIVMWCKHQICYLCFIQIKNDSEIKCPFCRQNIIIKQQYLYDDDKFSIINIRNKQFIFSYVDKQNNIECIKTFRLKFNKNVNFFNKCCLTNKSYLKKLFKKLFDENKHILIENIKMITNIFFENDGFTQIKFSKKNFNKFLEFSFIILLKKYQIFYKSFPIDNVITLELHNNKCTNLNETYDNS